MGKTKYMSYYRLKKELNWSLREVGIVVYDGHRDLQMAINSDKNEELFNFLLFLSEFRTSNDIENYNQLTKKEKIDIINYLKEKNYLQLFQAPVDLTRTDLFLNCFPNTNYLNFRKYRESCKIIIIGLGTVGSHSLDMLVKLGFENFVLIDGDKVEKKNLSAQSYFLSDVGKYKVKVMKSRYGEQASIQAHDQFITSIEDLSNLGVKINDDDIIINAADDYILMRNLAQSIIDKDLACHIIESGYGPLLQTVYLINSSQTAQVFCEYIDNVVNDSIKHINDNSGSILNGYMSAFMIGQIIIAPFIGKSTFNGSYDFFSDKLDWREKL
ncbi:ThiF family adenylyltransferase [Streptococcus sciuri]|uniref:ThiF family adenylyltransferase n=1 Tax=Streptococcus sciuri TaxID=2973939 RepID=A0ABT2F884_9STRE|nr:ThiF family adenylyltransferase [Streptococcus sciuri]MCS4488055.1 ThiF family adenylyltransferase [Streptococcus sciuri]